MKSNKLSETLEIPTLNTLREGFYICCKTWGIRQNTCVALTLLLNSRWQLAQILLWGIEMEKKGIKVGTTEVVQKAEDIHEYYLKKMNDMRLRM